MAIDLGWCRTRKQNLLGKRTEHICQKREKEKTNTRDEEKLMESEAGVPNCSLIGMSVGFFPE